jgi:hypothetical protein
MFNNLFPENCIVYENSEKYGGDRGATYDVTIWRISVARCISKATCTHGRTHRPISNTYCFSTATMTRERASLLRYTYIPPLYILILLFLLFMVFHIFTAHM